MNQYSNASNVPLSMAVFLATDHYDYDPDTVSATALLKPLRQIILGSRIPAGESAIELTSMVNSRMGTAIHDGIERAWKTNYKGAMQALGYPQRVIDRIRINPTEAELSDDIIPVYMEQRVKRAIGNTVISGKYDFIMEGRVEDFKSTSVFSAINKSNNDKYMWQGSIYRWLNPKIITKDEMAIQWIFTDWSKAKAMQDPNYPQQRIQQLILPLKSLAETEAFITRKLALIEQYKDAPEDQIPECSDEDLWRSEPVFKYYKNPEKTVRSTKNFDNMHDARVRMVEDGNVGIIIEKPGEATACKYCNAFPLCSQKDALIAKGELVL